MKYLKKQVFAVLMILCAVWVAGCSDSDDIDAKPINLTIVHVNDTHSHLDATVSSLMLNNVQTNLDMGGVTRLAAKIKDMRSKSENTLVLHAGDAVQGTLYFTKYEGAADMDFMNDMKFDAMAVGNHEFDRGPEFLAKKLIQKAQFPFLSANTDASADPNLKGLIKPYIIKEINEEKIGIIGLTTPETAVIASPGDKVVFSDPKTAAEKAIRELKDQNVNKIIVLSHLGYDADQELARQADGIDIIVGGHSHTLLGDYKAVGLTAQGDYPAKITGPSGKDVYIVQSWEWEKTVGVLDVAFDKDGVVTRCSGNAVLVVGDTFKQKNVQGSTVEVDAAKKAEILAFIEASPIIEVVREDEASKAKLATYTASIDELKKQVVATVSDDLLHIREPGTHTSGVVLADGSLIAPLVCEGMLWKANNAGQKVDAVIQNAGGVRIDIPAGDLTVAKVYELLPFGNTLFVLEMTGAEIKAALENGLKRLSGAFPYVAGIRYTADKTKPEGQRLVSVEFDAGTAFSDTTVYRVATNAYLAGGGDGYEVMKNAKGYRYDTGFGDAEVFMEYAAFKGVLSPPASTGITYLVGNPVFAVFSDPHIFDSSLLIQDGTAFQTYLAKDRKLLKESEAITKAAINEIKADKTVKFVIVSGDLTKDGEKVSHQKLASYLKILEDAGIQVYVVPGNHDVNNPHAMSYNGDAASHVESVTPAEFAQIYANYGYTQAIDRDPASLSYVAEPFPGLWLIAMDSCKYNDNQTLGEPVTSGGFSEQTLNWIVSKLAEAESRNKRVIGTMHHGILEHFTGQSVSDLSKEYVVDNWQTVSKTFADNGMTYVFTGHYHAQDVVYKTWENNGKTSIITDIETGSLVTSPCPYRTVTLNADHSASITSRDITAIEYNTGLMTFPDYAEAYLEEGITGMAFYLLTLPPAQGGYGLTQEQAMPIVPYIVEAFKAHYAGDENPTSETLAVINSYLQNPHPAVQMIGQMLMSYWTDLPPADNNLMFNPANPQ